MDLKDYRIQIDRIDKELMALLKERFDVSAAIGAYKREKGLPVLDAQREAEIVESLYESLAAEDAAESKSRHLVEVMKAIMTESRNYQAEAGPAYGVLGRRLSHSFSPRLHMDFGEYDYGLIEKEPEELVAYIRGGSFKGINVTIPYKRDVMPLCDRITDIAKESISVNTIYRDDEGRLIGDNTDYYGFIYMLKRENIEAEGRKVLVLGSGGVSGTVRKALYDLGAREVVIISRSGTDNYENIGRHADAELIVNATPMGMYPDNGSCAVDVSAFPKLEAVADLVYNPLRTKLVLDCIDHGIKACGGLSMLVAQGAKAVELFTGRNISDYDIESEIAKLEREMGSIVLIGMPGSGKTTVGMAVAEALGREFVDSDLYIAEREGRTAEDIIREDGIDAFRKIEAEAVREIMQIKGVVAAMGGGVVECAENCDTIRENSTVICLDRDIDALPDNNRPVSQEEGLDALFERRAPLYASWSDLSIENASVEETADVIAALVEGV